MDAGQILAACALIVCTTMLLRLNRGRLALTTAIPGLLMAVVCFWAGCLQVFTMYIPKGQYLLAVMGLLVMALMIVVFCGAFIRWRELMNIHSTVIDEYGEEVKALAVE